VPQNSRQYRLVVVHADGSLEPVGMYASMSLLNDAMQTVSRPPGIRYMCQEWTVGTATAEVPDPLIEMMTEYDI
jgi:hypothetical protein